MNLLPRILATAAAAALVVIPMRAQPQPRNVVVITIDGLRWQEFFGGADRDYFKRDKSGSGGEPERRFWRADAGERRTALMPFMWNTIAPRGQIFGDPATGSVAAWAKLTASGSSASASVGIATCSAQAPLRGSSMPW